MNNSTFESLIPVIAIGLFALVHAGFQLGVSVLTLLSGHSLGRRHALHRTLVLNVTYIAGVAMMTGLIIAGLLYVWDIFYYCSLTDVITTLAIASTTVGILVLVAYFRHGHGTMLWIPRAFADYLRNRAKSTKNTVEAAVLGAVTVVAELPFTFVVMASVSYIVRLYATSSSHLAIIAAYSVAISIPLAIVTILLAGGHRLSDVQRWREANKVFLQCASGIGLFAAALYLYVFYIGVSI